MPEVVGDDLLVWLKVLRWPLSGRQWVSWVAGVNIACEFLGFRRIVVCGCSGVDLTDIYRVFCYMIRVFV